MRIEHVYIAGNGGPGLIFSDDAEDFANGGGGGFSSGTFDIEHVVFENNQGGIFSRNSRLNVRNSVFKDNQGASVTSIDGEMEAEGIVVD